MRIKLFSCIAGIAGVFAAHISVQAHHAFAAEFDNGKPVRLEGTVTKWEWINPHAWINLDVTNEAGEVEKWRVEGGAPNPFVPSVLVPSKRRAKLIGKAGKRKT